MTDKTFISQSKAEAKDMEFFIRDIKKYRDNGDQTAGARVLAVVNETRKFATKEINVNQVGNEYLTKVISLRNAGSDFFEGLGGQEVTALSAEQCNTLIGICQNVGLQANATAGRLARKGNGGNGGFYGR